MNFKQMLVAILSFTVIGCAPNLPRQSVELSTAMGKDLSALHASHRELAQVLFNRMRNDINRFVDEVYAPYQVENLIA